jgi:methyltransferase (TIGR00027 family)
VVILGAGFDSRPYRFAGLNSTTRIFETDTPATQAYKFSVLKEQGAETGNTEYVPVDFEKDELFENLAEHGYDRRAKTLFLWEGVTFYLTADAVTGVLNTVRQNSAPGSRICFDFQTVRNPGDLIKTGISENIKFGIEEGRVEDFLSLNHYSSVEHLGSKKIEQKFMKKATGELFGTISPVMNFLIIGHR